MDKHQKYSGKFRTYSLPRTAFAIQRGSDNQGVSIDGVLYLKASSLLNGKGILASLTQNFHDFRNALEEPE